jgi:hypothetical protein
MFNFNKSYDLYFMHLNTFFWEGVLGFHQTLKRVYGVYACTRISRAVPGVSYCVVRRCKPKQQLLFNSSYFHNSALQLNMTIISETLEPNCVRIFQ